MSFPQSNLLIDRLSPATRSRLLQRFEPVPIPIKTVIYSAHETPRYAHFITSGLASILTEMEDGDLAEVGVVGREGLPEASHLLGPARVPTRCFMQIGGTALRIRFRDLEQLFFEDQELHRQILRFIQNQTLSLTQIAACNRLHEVEQRLARWLLMVQDRIDNPHLRLTHEFLAQMIGARRSTVTVVAGALQRSGLIEYSRGEVQIVNRELLEDVACECYKVTHSLFQNLFERPTPKLHSQPSNSN